METPSSTRRFTRSQARAQAMASASNTKINESNEILNPFSRMVESDFENSVSKSRTRNPKQQDRSVLIDITNDSPIVGVAMGSLLKSPSSAMGGKLINNRAVTKTPGSGEALLRGQVKSLLQRVAEETEISKLSFENRPFLHLKNLVNSPMGILAPTPANTPQIFESGSSIEMDSSMCPVNTVQEQLQICQAVISDTLDGKKSGTLESEKSLNRSLLLDFSEKSESTDSSSSSIVTDNGSEQSAIDDDNASSVWSMQVNGSEDEENGEWVDELCKGISKMNVNERAKKFSGKHTKFVYNSDDDEIVDKYEQVADEESEVSPPSVVRLKGLPTPKGKHMRFETEEEEED